MKKVKYRKNDIITGCFTDVKQELSDLHKNFDNVKVESTKYFVEETIIRSFATVSYDDYRWWIDFEGLNHFNSLPKKMQKIYDEIEECFTMTEENNYLSIAKRFGISEGAFKSFLYESQLFDVDGFTTEGGEYMKSVNKRY